MDCIHIHTKRNTIGIEATINYYKYIHVYYIQRCQLSTGHPLNYPLNYCRLAPPYITYTSAIPSYYYHYYNISDNLLQFDINYIHTYVCTCIQLYTYILNVLINNEFRKLTKRRCIFANSIIYLILNNTIIITHINEY